MNIDLDDRKLQILSKIVETYTATGEPVGSKYIATKLDSAISPATVRNDMAVLFNKGLLEQPHTSAGRIPSHLGYRVYVDSLMKSKPVTEPQKQELGAIFNRKYPDPEQILEDAAKVLAKLTGCAVVSTTLVRETLSVKKIDLVPVSDRTVVIVLVCSNGIVKTKTYRVDFILTPKITEFFVNFANGRLAGKSLNEISATYINSVAFSLGEYTDVFTPLLMAIYDLCRETNDGHIYRSGTSNLLEYEEMRARADRLFRLLNDHDGVMDLIGNKEGNITVTIGRENPQMELSDSSVIVSKYSIGKDSVGAIGLVGPIRMNYASMLPRVEYFTDLLSHALSELLDDDHANKED